MVAELEIDELDCSAVNSYGDAWIRMLHARDARALRWCRVLQGSRASPEGGGGQLSCQPDLPGRGLSGLAPRPVHDLVFCLLEIRDL